jgi:hypothetical protein
VTKNLIIFSVVSMEFLVATPVALNALDLSGINQNSGVETNLQVAQNCRSHYERGYTVQLTHSPRSNLDSRRFSLRAAGF